MLYDVILRIEYEYDNPPAGGHHHLRLMPLNIQGEQRLLTGLLTITPQPNERFDRKDFFDNSICQVSYHHAHPEIKFKVQARIERLEKKPLFNISPSLEQLHHEITNYHSLNAHSPHHFIAESSNIRFNPEMREYAKSHLQVGMNTFDIVQSIGRAIYKDMTFDPKATTVETSAAEAFHLRKGVCQDFTHIMITCLRTIGIPSGYVSGFLRTKPPEGQTERLEGADAMHAWVRAWCGADMGWVEYDPTNEMWVGTDHVVAAYGRDYDDVAPIRGVLKMAGDQSSKQAVDVIPIER